MNNNTNYDTTAFKRFEPNFQNNIKKSNNMATLAMRHITTKGADSNEVYDEISRIFYSEENINRIQKMIKKTIFERTKGQYKLDEDQDESDLLISMRAVFLEHSRFLPNMMVHQVKELNHKTIERIVPDMLSMIKQDEEYVNQLDKPIEPIALPVNVSRAGRLSLPSVTTTV